MYGGNIRFTTATYFAVAFIALFTIGGISGVMHASPPVDTQQQDTYFIVAHIHYVLFGGAIMGIFSGIYYWFPKMTGRFLNETLGKINFWLLFLGMNLTFFPMHFLGVSGMPRRIYRYDEGLGWDEWNMVATIGSYVIAFGVLVFVFNFFRTMGQEKTAGDNPWDGGTLEWATNSPPPEHDFDTIPEVRDRDPVWYGPRPRHRAAHAGRAGAHPPAAAVVLPADHRPRRAAARSGGALAPRADRARRRHHRLRGLGLDAGAHGVTSFASNEARSTRSTL